MFTPDTIRAAEGRLQHFLNATWVTLRRAGAVLALAAMPGLALATTFTDTTAGATFNVATRPLGGIATCDLVQGPHHYTTRTLKPAKATVSGERHDPYHQT